MSQDSPERKITELDVPGAGRISPAWQPLTPRGVAAFGHASGNRLRLVQLIIALLVALALLHLIFTGILPTIWAAVDNLPDQGHIENQTLIMSLASPKPLAEGRIVGFIIDLDQQSQDVLASDFQIECHRHDWQICSLPGCSTLEYPAGWRIELNRMEVASNLEAWGPLLLVLTGLITIFLLFLVWNLLALLYTPVPWLIAFYTNRTLTLPGAFYLASAAQLSGGLLLALAQVFYGMDWIDLFRFVILIVLHLPLTWFFLLISPLFLPRIQDDQSGLNPFTPSTRGEGESLDPGPDLPVNPNPFISPVPDADKNDRIP